MNPRDRLTCAIRNQIPDRVPVSLGMSEPGPFLGIDNLQLYWEEQIPLWKARLHAEGKFNGDVYFHVSVDASPKDPPIEKKNVREKKRFRHFHKGYSHFKRRLGNRLSHCQRLRPEYFQALRKEPRRRLSKNFGITEKP